VSFISQVLNKHLEKVETWNPQYANSNEIISYIDLSSVDKDKKAIDVTQVQRVLAIEAPSRARQIVKGTDILVSTVRPNLNGVAYVPDELENATASTGYCVLRASQSTLDPQYLFYWVQTKSFVNDMVSKATGASYPAVSDKIIKESKIPLPQLAEQQKIAAILDAADSLRQKDQQLVERYTALSQSLFLEMFGDPVTNPMEWNKKLFLDVFETKTGKLDSNAASANGSYPFFTCAKEALSIDTYSYDEEVLLLAGNNAAGIFDVKYYNGKFDAYQRTYILSIKDNQLTYPFMQISLEKKLKDLQRLSIGSSTQYLTMKILGRLEFITPPIALQNQFAERIQLIEAQKQQAQLSLEKSEALFNSLLQRAFTGELTAKMAA